MDRVSGWAFPIKADANSGRMSEVSGDELIRQSIMMILTTRKGERYLKPDFGCNLSDFVFREINYTTLKQIEAEAEESIEKWENRINELSVTAEVDPYNTGMVQLNIYYRVVNGGARTNLTYVLDVKG